MKQRIGQFSYTFFFSCHLVFAHLFRSSDGHIAYINLDHSPGFIIFCFHIVDGMVFNKPEP